MKTGAIEGLGNYLPPGHHLGANLDGLRDLGQVYRIDRADIQALAAH